MFAATSTYISHTLAIEIVLVNYWIFIHFGSIAGGAMQMSCNDRHIDTQSIADHVFEGV